jgi:hypothetical protein
MYYKTKSLKFLILLSAFQCQYVSTSVVQFFDFVKNLWFQAFEKFQNHRTSIPGFWSFLES